MSTTQDQAGATRRRFRRDPSRDCTAMSSPRYVRLLITTDEQAMADEAHARPLTGSPPGRLKLGALRALRDGRDPGHDFNDPGLERRMKRECLRIYIRAFGAISERDWDEAFNFAYAQAWRTERDKGPIDNLLAWLTRAAYNAVVSDHRKRDRLDLRATEDFLTEQAVTDLAETVDDRQILRDAIVCLKTSLPERVRLVWTMRFAGDYEPSEIQRQLGISKKAYEKDLELGSSLVISRLESVRESGVCETPDMTSMVRAYAIWGEEHGSERAKLAREHLDKCPACRHTVRVLRAAQRAAAFLPPPILGLTGHPPALGVVLQTTENLAGRIQDGLWRVTERVHDGLLRMKYFVTNIVSRGPANAPVNADRTATVLGAGGTGGTALVTKAIVGCIAAGAVATGTGACLKAAGVGVPGLGLNSAVHHHVIHRGSLHAVATSRSATVITPAAGVVPTSSTRPGGSSSTHVVRARPTNPHPSPHVPSKSLGYLALGGSSGGSSASSSSESSSPVRATAASVGQSGHTPSSEPSPQPTQSGGGTNLSYLGK
jgi:DNA-directed RNA polymerase specialized sigma24 family protein